MDKKKKYEWLKFPLIYCRACKNCKHRNPEWKNLFDTWHFVRCTDVNGTHIKTIIPFILWSVDWCKICTDKKYK